mgnify:CR=1 FL=1
MNKRHWRRFCALFLAAAILITGIPFQSAAKENTVEMIIRGDAFQNRPINIFGHSHRSITCYYVNPVEGHVPAFCLQPGKKLPNHTVSSYTRYDAEPGASVPVIGSFDRYLPMTLAYEWMVSGNYYDKTRYAMVQTYLWGCLAGYEEAWDVQEEMMHKLEGVIRDGKVLPFFHEMREYVENGLEEYDNQGNTDLPEWNGRQQRMELKDGRYELTLDISSCPQLKNAVWQFPDGNWIYEIGADGTSVTFIYQGETPSGRISSGPLSGIKQSITLTFSSRRRNTRCRWDGWIWRIRMQRSGLKQARLWTLRKVRDWNFTGIKRYLSPIIRCRWKNTAQKQESP